jgi:flagellar basal body-associated protein FliL
VSYRFNDKHNQKRKERRFIKTLLKLIRIFLWSTSGGSYEWFFKKEKQPKEQENGFHESREQYKNSKIFIRQRTETAENALLQNAIQHEFNTNSTRGDFRGKGKSPETV